MYGNPQVCAITEDSVQYQEISKGDIDTVSGLGQAEAKTLHILIIPREEGDDDC